MCKICELLLLNISIALRRDHFSIKCQIQSIFLLMLKVVHYYMYDFNFIDEKMLVKLN